MEYDAVQSNDSIFTFGSNIDMGCVGSFDPKTQTWKRLSFTGFDARRFPTACIINGKIYVMGGKLAYFGCYLDEVQVFDATKLN